MERFWLIESISVFSSYHITVKVLFRNPSGSIKESHRLSESTSSDLPFPSISGSHWIIKISTLNTHAFSKIRFHSESRINSKRLPSCCRPITTTAWSVLVRMRVWDSLFPIFMINCLQSRILMAWDFSEI